ncbi:hypothetical protein SAMN05192561_11819 [Halopenitus malekzadehii]|uniref:Uncharacterized protein n=1 Tax=Halopenitus malekzadehii TaxID=1267564 RepID=A0A1H6JUB6_9EURY|nr:hypothetical protein SAMN05192561_11819 [Halopenitus malekzadehii]
MAIVSVEKGNTLIEESAHMENRFDFYVRHSKGHYRWIMVMNDSIHIVSMSINGSMDCRFAVSFGILIVENIAIEIHRDDLVSLNDGCTPI